MRRQLSVFSQKAKDILRKDKKGESLSLSEINTVIDEAREFRNNVKAKDNPDYFTAVFIEIGMLKKKNGNKSAPCENNP